MVRILIADDDPEVCGFLRRIINSTISTVEIVVVEDGAEALEELLETSFALAILDVEMPQANGLEVVRVLRRREIETSIVLLTGWPTVEIARRAAVIGVQDFLEKPVIIAEIVNAVRHLLRKSKSSTEPVETDKNSS